MTGRTPFDRLAGELSPERRRRVEARKAALRAEMSMAELRRARQLTQDSLGDALNVGQPAVAKLEKRTDMYVSNLRRYIRAMGGDLDIVARFPDGEVRITNFGDIGAP